MRDGTPRPLDDRDRPRSAQYRRFLQVAGGGVTVSGGEPLLQPGSSARCSPVPRSSACTPPWTPRGFLGDRADDALLDATDLVLLDIKSCDPATYRRVTSTESSPTLRFARRLAEPGNPIWVRFVLVPGLTDDPANVDGLADFAAALGNRGTRRGPAVPPARRAQVRRPRLPFPLRDTPAPDAHLIHRTTQIFAERDLPVLSA